jgi:hypothetical protein
MNVSLINMIRKRVFNSNLRCLNTLSSVINKTLEPSVINTSAFKVPNNNILSYKKNIGIRGTRESSFAERYNIKDKEELKKLIQNDLYEEDNRNTVLSLYDIAHRRGIDLDSKDYSKILWACTVLIDSGSDRAYNIYADLKATVANIPLEFYTRIMTVCARRGVYIYIYVYVYVNIYICIHTCVLCICRIL